MKIDGFKNDIIQKLGLQNSSVDEQAEMLGRIQGLANTRFRLIMPELLGEDKWNQVNEMERVGKDEDQILEWIFSQLPDVEKLMEAIIGDIVDEVNDGIDDLFEK